MQKKLFLKPLRSAQKAVILKEAQLLTIEAQNALLKVLEEPPEQTIIILSADSEEALLPTIRSRCQIIQLAASRILLTPEEEKAYTETVQELRHLTIGKALSLSEKLAKNKEETAVWLEKLILFLRTKMLQAAKRKDKETSFYVTLIQLAQQTYQTVLHTNVNKRVVLEQFFLSLVS